MGAEIMKRILLAILLVSLAFPPLAVAASAASADSEAAADYNGYIVQLDLSEASLFSDRAQLPEGTEEIYAPEGLYLIQDIELVKQLDEAELLVYVEPNYIVELLDTPDDTALSSQWYLSAIGMDYVWDNSITGSGVRIGIIDSGVNAQHEDLQGANILTGRSYCEDKANGVEGNTEDDVGHGTFVTGIIAAATNNATGIAGIAPSAEIVPLKAFYKNDSGDTVGSTASVAGALLGAVDLYHCQVINMSLGVAVDSETLRNAVDHASKQGVILIAAAGNAGTDALVYPAAYGNVIGVGAVDSSQTVASFSQRNTSVFITAPGQTIYGLSASGNNAYKTGKGTSYSAPMVTAAAALALSVCPELTPEQFQHYLKQTAADLGKTGYDTSYGWGLLRVDRLLSALQNILVDTSDTARLSLWRSGLESGQTVLVAAASYTSAGQLLSVTTAQVAAADTGTLTATLQLTEQTQSDHIQIMILDPTTWTPLMAASAQPIAGSADEPS
jgi:subtilisin family serine protease